MLTGAGTVLADIAAIGVILGLLSSAVTWLIGSDRAQAVAGYDGAAPRAFGYFSRRLGTPIVVNLVSGVVSTIVLVLTLTLTSGNAAKYFSATLGVVISMVTIVYVLIFPAVIKLRYSHPDVPRPYRIPGGKVGLWTAGILTTAWARSRRSRSSTRASARRILTTRCRKGSRASGFSTRCRRSYRSW